MLNKKKPKGGFGCDFVQTYVYQINLLQRSFVPSTLSFSRFSYTPTMIAERNETSK